MRKSQKLTFGLLILSLIVDKRAAVNKPLPPFCYLYQANNYTAATLSFRR